MRLRRSAGGDPRRAHAPVARFAQDGPGNKGKRDRLAAALRYLEMHQHRLRYAELRKRDIDIDTGAVQGAVRRGSRTTSRRSVSASPWRLNRCPQSPMQPLRNSMIRQKGISTYWFVLCAGAGNRQNPKHQLRPGKEGFVRRDDFNKATARPRVYSLRSLEEGLRRMIASPYRSDQYGRYPLPFYGTGTQYV